MIDQQERTEAGASGDDLGAPFSLSAISKSALIHHPQAGGGTAFGSRALSEGRPAGRPFPAQYGQASRRHRRLVHRAELRRCTGGLGASAPNKLRRVYTGALLATMVTAPEVREFSTLCSGPYSTLQWEGTGLTAHCLSFHARYGKLSAGPPIAVFDLRRLKSGNTPHIRVTQQAEWHWAAAGAG